jgi:ankyrin repeat protein
LIWAAKKANIAAVKLLLAWRADAEAKDDDGKSALSYASELGNSELEAILREHAAGTTADR